MRDTRFYNLDYPMPIEDNEQVKVTQMNHILEVIHVKYESEALNNYRKIDKGHYVVAAPDAVLERRDWTDEITGEEHCHIIDTGTGEILELHEYNLNENRSQNIAGLKRTFKKLRDLINANFAGANNELFITLTYRLNEDGTPMNDVKKASIDFDRFIKRFRRKYPDLEYIAVLEPQASSAWHWHVLAKFTEWKEKKHIRIDNNEIIEPLWSWGWSRTKRLNHIDNIGAYLSGYLANVEINDENKDALFDTVYKVGRDIDIEEKEVIDEHGQKVTKKFVKGGRMYLYPSGTNLFRYSRGIAKPESKIMTYAESKEITGGRNPTYLKSVAIVGCDSNMEEHVLNTITYEHYNMARGENQSNKKSKAYQPARAPPNE